MKRQLAMGLVLVCAAAGVASYPALRSASAATTTVAVTDDNGENNRFSPSVINVAVGDTVEWDWTGTAAHSVKSDADSAEVFSNGTPAHLIVTGTYSHQFNTAGSFNYHCTVHDEMTGTVNVLAATATPQSSATPVPATSTPGTSTPAPTDTPEATGTPETATSTATGTASPVATVSTEPIVSATAAAIADVAPPDADTVAAAGATTLPRSGAGGAAASGGLRSLSALLAFLGAAFMGAGVLRRRRA